MGRFGRFWHRMTDSAAMKTKGYTMARSVFGGVFGCVLAVTLTLFSGAAAAQDAASTEKSATTEKSQRQTIGWGRFFNNDYIGDRKDRWHSSSYTISRLRGPEWTGSLPNTFGEVLEFRFRAENITPETLSAPAAKDRRYAGVMSFGYHSHQKWRGDELSMGADLVLIGPQTGLSQFQDSVHDALGLPDGKPSYDAQFANDVRLSGTAELGRQIALGKSLTLRPFVEGQVGFETMARAGVDLTLGNLAKDGLMLRDVTTGQRYSAVQGPLGKGLSLTFGGDVARVASSYLLPEGGAVTASPTRSRLRAGINWQGEKSFVFFGATYLSPEFEEQSEGQTVGSLSLLVRF